MDRQVDPQHPPGRSGSHGGHHGGGDPGHLPPGRPADPLPGPDQRTPAARDAGGLQAGREQTQPEILFQVGGRGLRVSHVISVRDGQAGFNNSLLLLMIHVDRIGFIC